MHAQWYRIRSEKKIGGSPLLLGKRNRKKHEAVETVNVVFGKKEKEVLFCQQKLAWIHKE